MKGLLKRKESMSISKEELLKKKHLQFIQFKRFAFTKISHSYSHPYMLFLYKKEQIKEMKESSLPTYYEYNQIDILVHNKQCHYNSLFKEISLLINPNEYLYKFFHRKEIPILLAISVEVELYYFPNVFPNGHIILMYLENYTKKVRSINKKRSSEKNEILNSLRTSQKINDTNNSERTKKEEFDENNLLSNQSNSNLLKSIIDTKMTANNITTDYNNNDTIYRGITNKKNDRDSSVYSIEGLVDCIKKLEEDREAIKPVRRQGEKILIDSKRLSVLMTSMQNNYPTKKEKEVKPIYHKTKKSSKSVLPPFEFKSNLTSGKKFKTIGEFIEGQHEKEKTIFNKKKAWKTVIDLFHKKNDITLSSASSTINIKSKNNVLHKSILFKNSHHIPKSKSSARSLSSGDINSMSLYEYQSDLNVSLKTQLLLDKVRKTMKFEKKKLQKSSTLEKIIKCPFIYSVSDRNTIY